MYKAYLLGEQSKELEICVKEAFQSDTDWTEANLKENNITEILQEDEEICDENVRETIVGYPTRPLWREIANVFKIWTNTGHCPVLDLPNFDLLDERTHTEKRADKIKEITPILEDLKESWQISSHEYKVSEFIKVVKILCKRGILDLLGLRNTAGTYQMFPPPRKIIEDTFDKPNKPDSAAKLSVGARALSKHCHRDETMSWWGNCTGKEIEKNAHATDILNKVLDNARWINIHSLPHHVIVIETREEHGYGLRWTADGKQFRGFLEPQMVDGHEVGWKH